MQKPSGIDLTAGLMGLLIILDLILLFVLPTPALPANAQGINTGTIMAAAKGFTVFVAIIELLFVYFYSKGQNWARWLVMIGCVLILLGLIRVGTTFAYSPIAGALAIVKALVAIYVLYFVNTPAVKAWFTKPAGTVPPQYGV